MKFFKWSIVPTKTLIKMRDQGLWGADMVREVYEVCSDKEAKFFISETKYSFVVVKSSRSFYINIKEFPFGDDKEYARLCAGELLEHLYETI